MITVTHNRSKCIGCRQCVSVCPEYWYIDDDGKAMLRNSTDKKGIFVGKINEEDEKCMQEAEKLCPVHIINIEK